MLQEITISSTSSISLKPLLEIALHNEKKLLKHGMNRTHQRLENFENQYKMSSTDFDHKFRKQEIEETLDFIDWQMELKALSMLKEQYQALNDAKFN